MPIYEYVCTACEHRFEKRRPFEEAGAPEKCPECGEPANKALTRFSAFNKGSGGVLSGIKGASGWTG